MLRPARLRAFAALSLAFGACTPDVTGDPPLDPPPLEAEDVRTTARANLAALLAPAGAALDTLGGSELAFRLGLDAAAGIPDAPARAEQWAGALFDPEALETRTATRLTYRLDATRTCAALEAGADCVRALEGLELRLAVTQPSEGELQITVLTGATPARTLDLQLGPSALSVAADFAHLRAALEALSPEASQELPETFEGALSLVASATGPESISLEAHVTRPIHVASSGYRLQLPARPRAITLSLEAGMQLARSTLDLGEVALELPLAALAAECESGCEAPSGTLSLALAASRHAVTLSTAEERLRIESTGLGASALTAALDGQQLLRLDLNAAIASTLELLVGFTGEALELSLRPGFSLDLHLDLAPLASRLTGIPQWALSERLSVRFDQATEPRLSLPLTSDAPPPADEPAPPPAPVLLARILAGSLDLDSAALGRSITARAGECLLRDPQRLEPTEPEHPFARLFVERCP